MSWSEIKATPTVELQGLLKAYDNYTTYHAFDGYDSKDIGNMAKDKPQVRVNYQRTQRLKERFDVKMGKIKRLTSFSEIIN